jgi:hypothetical protein
MAQPSQIQTKGKSRAKHAGKRRNGNSRANGKASRANGNGHRANGNGHRLNGGNGNGAVGTEEARRIATEMGNAMLIATSIETARHSDDVELITGAISDKIGLSESERDDVLAGARLHDIGKASVPPGILLKPGPLYPEEWAVMREHTIVGEQILASVEELKGIARLVRHSHERWDGGGYPDGLAGDEIPLGSRIIFCADAFHAVRSNRPYRNGRSAKAALVEVSRCAGTQFDPHVVAALEAVVRELRIVGPTRRAGRSSRLSALLLMLVIGGGSSAVAHTDLLGDRNPARPSPAPQAVVANPSSLFGPVLFDQLRALGLTGPAHPIGPSGGGPGSNPPGSPVNVGPGSSGPGGYEVGNAGGAGGTLGESQAVVGGSGGGATPPGNGGSSGGGSDGANGGGTGGSNAGGTGNGGGNGGTGNGGGGGGGGNAGGTNPNANPGSWAGGGSPGQSGNAPGHGGSCPGNSCNAPGHNH